MRARRSREDEGFSVSDGQKAFFLKQGADGMPVSDICRKAGISQGEWLPTERPNASPQAAQERQLRGPLTNGPWGLVGYPTPTFTLKDAYR